MTSDAWRALCTGLRYSNDLDSVQLKTSHHVTKQLFDSRQFILDSVHTCINNEITGYPHGEIVTVDNMMDGIAWTIYICLETKWINTGLSVGNKERSVDKQHKFTLVIHVKGKAMQVFWSTIFRRISQDHHKDITCMHDVLIKGELFGLMPVGLNMK